MDRHGTLSLHKNCSELTSLMIRESFGIALVQTVVHSWTQLHCK